VPKPVFASVVLRALPSNLRMSGADRVTDAAGRESSFTFNWMSNYPPAEPGAL